MRMIVGLVLGAAFAAIAVFLMTRAAHYEFPGSITQAALAAPGNAEDPLGQVPLEAKVMIAMGWFLGALVGASMADIVSQRGFVGWLVAGFVVLFVLGLSVVVPHPTWMSVAGVFGPLLGGYAARQLTRVPL